MSELSHLWSIYEGVRYIFFQVELINDGPVTLELESLPEKKDKPEPAEQSVNDKSTSWKRL